MTNKYKRFRDFAARVLGEEDCGYTVITLIDKFISSGKKKGIPNNTSAGQVFLRDERFYKGNLLRWEESGTDYCMHEWYLNPLYQHLYDPDS